MLFVDGSLLVMSLFVCFLHPLSPFLFLHKILVNVQCVVMVLKFPYSFQFSSTAKTVDFLLFFHMNGSSSDSHGEGTAVWQLVYGVVSVKQLADESSASLLYTAASST